MPRTKRPSGLPKPDPHASLPPEQAEAMKALAADCRYITVGGGCRVLEVKGERNNPIRPATLKALVEAGMVEIVMLAVYQKREAPDG